MMFFFSFSFVRSRGKKEQKRMMSTIRSENWEVSGEEVQASVMSGAMTNQPFSSTRIDVAVFLRRTKCLQDTDEGRGMEGEGQGINQLRVLAPRAHDFRRLCYYTPVLLVPCRSMYPSDKLRSRVPDNHIV